ncbi:helix-turn-helix transcriptional regulator [Streptomyces antnestii]|uniref:helix-turn-helix transcriptional regulator n=1 Tax=Streptomyces antnestii TaxID=2494256 RepID=UPI0021D53675|nr:hypothetical protein [Streptomyces sp. San01]
MLPSALLRLEKRQLHALTATVVDDADGGAAVLLLPVLDGLVDEVSRPGLNRREQLARTVADILATVALERIGGQPESALWERITASVRTRLGEPGLAPQDIADRHAISLRYLHRLFQRQGTTVGAWVRARRLEAAREELFPARRRPPVDRRGGRPLGLHQSLPLQPGLPGGVWDVADAVAPGGRHGPGGLTPPVVPCRTAPRALSERSPPPLPPTVRITGLRQKGMCMKRKAMARTLPAVLVMLSVVGSGAPSSAQSSTP